MTRKFLVLLERQPLNLRKTWLEKKLKVQVSKANISGKNYLLFKISFCSKNLTVQNGLIFSLYKILPDINPNFFSSAIRMGCTILSAG